jgi:hypothetical protein
MFRILSASMLVLASVAIAAEPACVTLDVPAP